MHLTEIIGKFQCAKRLSDNSYQVKCSGHKDDKASLTITEEDDKILMHCHARLLNSKHFGFSRVDRERFI